MKAALKQAYLAFEQGEIPVGAVIVANGKIISQAHNQTQMLKDPTAHAEMLAITSACNYLGAKYLTNCEIYITLEPCPMCAGAIKWAQISKIYFGASDEKNGYQSFLKDAIFNKNSVVTKGIESEKCAQLLSFFFEKLRENKK